MDNVGKMAARTLAGLVRSASSPQPTYATGTVQRVDKDGTVWVTVDGAESPTPALSVVSAKEGDAVELRVAEGDATVTANHTSPVTDDSAAREAREIAAGAEGVAAEAAAVASATNQHFWADGNGVHVATVEGDATGGPNLLANSNGILLREDAMNMAAFTPSAVSFFDGQGNQAANVVATFGASGAAIGADGGGQVLVDANGIDFTAVDAVTGETGGASVIYDDYQMVIGSDGDIVLKSGNRSMLYTESESESLQIMSYATAFTTARAGSSTGTKVDLYACDMDHRVVTAESSLTVHPAKVVAVSGTSGFTLENRWIQIDTDLRMSSGKAVTFQSPDATIATGPNSSSVYNRFVMTSLGNIRHDTSADGTSWTTKRYFIGQYVSGDSFTVNINTGGFVTGSSASIRVSVPLQKGAASGLGVTCTDRGTVTVRGVNGYCHGSSASAGVVPSSVTASLREGWVDLTLAMASTTGAVNNTPVGVAISGMVLEFE